MYAVINSNFESFLHVNQGVTTNGTMNFGRDVTKEQKAGIIGYQIATSGALDIYGAGTAVGARGVKLWDNVTVPGTLAVTGTANTGALTAASLQVQNNATFGNGATITSGDLNVPTGELRAGSLYARGGVYAVINSSFESFLHVNQGVTTNGTMNFGRDVTKEQNAGIIGYQIATSGALDIYGAGTAVGARGVKLWDNVTVPGTLGVTGTATTGALTASSLSTPALTVAGTRVYPQVNADCHQRPSTDTQQAHQADAVYKRSDGLFCWMERSWFPNSGRDLSGGGVHSHGRWGATGDSQKHCHRYQRLGRGAF